MRDDGIKAPGMPHCGENHGRIPGWIRRMAVPAEHVVHNWRQILIPINE
jgi:hypothetical protein